MPGFFGGKGHVARKKPKPRGFFTFDQGAYGVDDFKNSFGAIDRVDDDAELGRDIIHVWFKDRYEWHPVYPGLYIKKHGDDDNFRSDNCIHAAMVELKDKGAADYWVKGEVTVPLSPLMDPPTSPRSH